jgi:peptidyl-dipeptidase A
MDREGDVRILQNIKNNEKWMETTLHELGHAIYSSNIDRSLPFILRDSAHTLTTEAIAMLFGRENTNPTFLKEYCELSEEKITELAEKLFKAKRLRQLVFARWAQVMVRFEGALYKNPDQDLNKLWWQLVKKYQLIDFERDKPDWASKVHFTIAPIYYHNYVFGELFASQLHHHVLSNFLKTNSKNYSYLSSNEISNFLKNEIFIPGKKYRWDKLIEKSTREQLNPAHFVKEFCDNQATN